MIAFQVIGIKWNAIMTAEAVAMERTIANTALPEATRARARAVRDSALEVARRAQRLAEGESA